jgi:hypothetical protein
MIHLYTHIKDLLKHTPEEHPDFADLSKALEKIKKVTNTINEKQRDFERNTKVLAIQDLFGNNEVSTSFTDSLSLPLQFNDYHFD